MPTGGFCVLSSPDLIAQPQSTPTLPALHCACWDACRGWEQHSKSIRNETVAQKAPTVPSHPLFPPRPSPSDTGAMHWGDILVKHSLMEMSLWIRPSHTFQGLLPHSVPASPPALLLCSFSSLQGRASWLELSPLYSSNPSHSTLRDETETTEFSSAGRAPAAAVGAGPGDPRADSNPLPPHLHLPCSESPAVAYFFFSIKCYKFCFRKGKPKHKTPLANQEVSCIVGRNWVSYIPMESRSIYSSYTLWCFLTSLLLPSSLSFSFLLFKTFL